jgi:hypothetical protein
MDSSEMQAILAADIRAYGENSPRTRQSREGVLGPSDIGFCRQKATLTTKGIQPTDEVSIAAAQIGTAVHSYVAVSHQEQSSAARLTSSQPTGTQSST